MNEEKLLSSEKIRAFINKTAGYFLAVLVCGVYVATALLKMGETGKSIEQIICDGVTAFLVGMVLTRIFSVQGIMRGKEDGSVQAAIDEHGAQIMKIAPYVDKLDDWCDIQTALALRRERTKYLASRAMKYSQYFEDDGVAIPFVEKECTNRRERKAERRRRRSYYKAVDIKVSPLLAAVIIGGGEKVEDPFDFGPSISEYENKCLRWEGITKIITALIFGYYTVEIIQNFSLADLIWKLFQVGLFCAGGIVQLNHSYLFMVNDYRKRIMLCTGKLREFEAYEGKTNNKKEEKEDVMVIPQT